MVNEGPRETRVLSAVVSLVDRLLVRLRRRGPADGSDRALCRPARRRLGRVPAGRSATAPASAGRHLRADPRHRTVSAAGRARGRAWSATAPGNPFWSPTCAPTSSDGRRSSPPRWRPASRRCTRCRCGLPATCSARSDCSAPGPGSSPKPIDWSPRRWPTSPVSRSCRNTRPPALPCCRRCVRALAGRMQVEQAKGFLSEMLDVSVADAFAPDALLQPHRWRAPDRGCPTIDDRPARPPGDPAGARPNGPSAVSVGHRWRARARRTASSTRCSATSASLMCSFWLMRLSRSNASCSVPPERLRMMPIAWSITARVRSASCSCCGALPGAGQQLRVVHRDRRGRGELGPERHRVLGERIPARVRRN